VRRQRQRRAVRHRNTLPGCPTTSMATANPMARAQTGESILPGMRQASGREAPMPMFPRWQATIATRLHQELQQRPASHHRDSRRDY